MVPQSVRINTHSSPALRAGGKAPETEGLRVHEETPQWLRVGDQHYRYWKLALLDRFVVVEVPAMETRSGEELTEIQIDIMVEMLKCRFVALAEVRDLKVILFGASAREGGGRGTGALQGISVVRTKR